MRPEGQASAKGRSAGGACKAAGGSGWLARVHELEEACERRGRTGSSHAIARDHKLRGCETDFEEIKQAVGSNSTNGCLTILMLLVSNVYLSHIGAGPDVLR